MPAIHRRRRLTGTIDNGQLCGGGGSSKRKGKAFCGNIQLAAWPAINIF